MDPDIAELNQLLVDWRAAKARLLAQMLGIVLALMFDLIAVDAVLHFAQLLTFLFPGVFP